jgi:hypothetical protein
MQAQRIFRVELLDIESTEAEVNEGSQAGVRSWYNLIRCTSVIILPESFSTAF